MKTLFNIIRPAAMVTLFALTISTAAVAQKNSVPVPSREGYWVVESTKQPTRQTVVRFYNNAHQLVYQENLQKARLNIYRIKTKTRLDGALEQALTQWASTKQIQTDQNLVAAQFRK